jgi:hypothetical protein
MKEDIKDLIKISLIKDSNMPLLIEDAYRRGLEAGKELAKRKIIEAIEQEK